MSHSDHDDDDDALSRIFDDGRRLILREEETDRSPAGLVALDTAACTGTECPCHEMDLLAWPVALVHGELVEDDVPPLQALIDVESGRIRVEDAPEPGTG